MNIHGLTLIVACGVVLAPLQGLAQVKAAAPIASAAGASAPAARNPRLLSPEDKRDNATAGTELRPEHPVVPQVKLPLGETPPVPSAGGASGGVDDAPARCLALKSKTARTECQARLRDTVKPQAR